MVLSPDFTLKSPAELFKTVDVNLDQNVGVGATGELHYWRKRQVPVNDGLGGMRKVGSVAPSHREVCPQLSLSLCEHIL